MACGHNFEANEAVYIKYNVEQLYIFDINDQEYLVSFQN